MRRAWRGTPPDAAGVRPIDSDSFSTTGLVWDQFSDSDPNNDFVTQNYNPANGPLGNGEAILLRTHVTWSNVATSTVDYTTSGGRSGDRHLNVTIAPGPEVPQLLVLSTLTSSRRLP